MPTSYPSDLDSIQQPTSANYLDDAGVEHAELHATEIQAIEAIQTKVGETLSLDNESIDYLNKLLIILSGNHPKGTYKEITTIPFPSKVTYYTDSGKTIKLVEKTIIRDTQQKPTTIIYRLYNETTSNTIVRTITETIMYSGVFETSRTRTIS